MAEIRDWDVTAANNNDPSPNGWPEGMNYSDVNNAARENMAVIARWYADTNGSLVSTGAGNTYALAPSRTFTAFANGMVFTFRADKTNTGNATVTVPVAGSAAAKTQANANIAAGAIQSGGIYTVIYSTAISAFVLSNDNVSALTGIPPNPQCTITGTANALIATPDGTSSALVDGLEAIGRAVNNNTGAITFNYDGTGDKDVSDVDAADQVKAGLIYKFVYNLSLDEWQIDGQLGHGQVWRTETSSRSSGTLETNSSHRAIKVAFSSRSSSAASNSVIFEIDGNQVYNSGFATNIVEYGCFFEIPAGSTYEVTWTNQTGVRWMELK